MAFNIQAVCAQIFLFTGPVTGTYSKQRDYLIRHFLSCAGVLLSSHQKSKKYSGNIGKRILQKSILYMTREE